MRVSINVEVKVGMYVSVHVHGLGRVCGLISQIRNAALGLVLVDYLFTKDDETRLASTLQNINDCHPVWWV